jgi:hypothetical protein
MFGKYKLKYYIHIFGYTYVNRCVTLYLGILLQFLFTAQCVTSLVIELKVTFMYYHAAVLDV